MQNKYNKVQVALWALYLSVAPLFCYGCGKDTPKPRTRWNGYDGDVLIEGNNGSLLILLATGQPFTTGPTNSIRSDGNWDVTDYNLDLSSFVIDDSMTGLLLMSADGAYVRIDWGEKDIAEFMAQLEKAPPVNIRVYLMDYLVGPYYPNYESDEIGDRERDRE